MEYPLDNDSLSTESLRSAIHEFKAQQEKYNLFLSKTSATGAIGPARSERTLPNVLNIDCVLMPCCPSFATPKTFEGRPLTAPLKKVWPSALLAQYSTNATRVGFIEEIGSLWRLCERKDQHPGTRVILQTSEMGQERRFLGADLKLVEKEKEAVLWNVKVLTKFHDDLSSRNPKHDAERGIFVQFENVGTIARGITPTAKLTAPDDVSQRSDSSLLTFKYTDLLNKGEVTMEQPTLPSPASNDGGSKESMFFSCTGDPAGMDVYKSFVWELTPDSWVGSDLGFLEGFVDGTQST